MLFQLIPRVKKLLLQFNLAQFLMGSTILGAHQGKLLGGVKP